MRRRAARLSWVAALLGAAALAGCGYQLVGRGGSFPQGARKVAVTTFKNGTDRYGLEGEASSAFVQELMATGKVEITSRDEADAWFEGTLLTYETTPIAYTADRKVIERRLNITAKLAFFLKGQDKPFWSEDRVGGKAEFPVSDNLVRDSDAEREAMSKALVDMASGVISRLVEGF